MEIVGQVSAEHVGIIVIVLLVLLGAATGIATVILSLQAGRSRRFAELYGRINALELKVASAITQEQLGAMVLKVEAMLDKRIADHEKLEAEQHARIETKVDHVARALNGHSKEPD